MAAADVVERIRAREAVLHETVIARADALMAVGDWVLADELLKSLKSAPRALVRRAEMALTMNRLEGAGQRMTRRGCRRRRCWNGWIACGMQG